MLADAHWLRLLPPAGTCVADNQRSLGGAAASLGADECSIETSTFPACRREEVATRSLLRAPWRSAWLHRFAGQRHLLPTSADEKEVVADSIIIATGAVARRLPFKGSDEDNGFWNKGISACAVRGLRMSGRWLWRMWSRCIWHCVAVFTWQRVLEQGHLCLRVVWFLSRCQTACVLVVHRGAGLNAQLRPLCCHAAQQCPPASNSSAVCLPCIQLISRVPALNLLAHTRLHHRCATVRRPCSATSPLQSSAAATRVSWLLGAKV